MAICYIPPLSNIHKTYVMQNVSDGWLSRMSLYVLFY